MTRDGYLKQVMISLRNYLSTHDEEHIEDAKYCLAMAKSEVKKERINQLFH